MEAAVGAVYTLVIIFPLPFIHIPSCAETQALSFDTRLRLVQGVTAALTHAVGCTVGGAVVRSHSDAGRSQPASIKELLLIFTQVQPLS